MASYHKRILDTCIDKKKKAYVALGSVPHFQDAIKRTHFTVYSISPKAETH